MHLDVFLTVALTLGAPTFDTPEARRDVLARIEKVLSSLEAAHRELPRDSFDVAGVIAVAGRDPAKLFAWVRDQTAWVPYIGSLRGPTGVLLDRCGNSLDRSLLLAELLRAAGLKARLAQAPLPAEKARELLSKIRSTPVSPPSGVDASERPAPATAQDVERSRLAEEAVERISSRTAALRAALKANPQGDEASRAETEAALADHWWVEVESKGAWTALDPLLADAEPGSSIVAPATRIEPTAGPRTFLIPATSCHEVEIRLVVERLESGKLSERQVFSHSLRPSDFIGQRISLIHHPLAWPEGLKLGGGRDSEELMKTTLLAQKEWLPILQVGGSRISKATFTDRGEVNESPVLDARSKMAKGVGNALGGLGALNGGGDEVKSDAMLTAEWLELEIRSPGRPVQKIRREIFDIIGPARRASNAADLARFDERRLDRALALFGETEILLLCSRLTPDLIAHLDAADLLRRRGSFTALASIDDAAHWKETAGRLAWEATRPQPLADFAILRQGLSRFGDSSFLDRPNVVTYVRRHGWDAKRGFTLRDIIDVAANHVAFRRGAGVDPYLAALEQGVVDTVAENLALEDTLDDSENTATVFALAEAAGSATLTLSAADAAIDAHAWPADVEQRIRGDLAAGYVVVVPKELVTLRGALLRTGWWRVDARTGETIGVMDSGFHQDDAEYSADTVITTREQALRRHLEWFQRQDPTRYYRGPPHPSAGYDLGAHWRSANGIEALQATARAILAQMDYLGLGL